MPKISLGAGVLTIMALTAPAAFAQSETSSRYTLAPTENGFVRLDTVTGAMSLCSRSSRGWFCRIMGSNDDAPQQSEIERLKSANAELRSELLRLERRITDLGRHGSSDAAPQAVPNFELPKEEDVDEAVDYLEGMIRKFRERFEDFGEKTRPQHGSAPSVGPVPDQSPPPDQGPDEAPDQKQDGSPSSPSPNSAPPMTTPDEPGDTPL